MAEAAIVTLGERGAIVATVDGEIEIRPPKVTVRSTVGAGDSFVGALTLGLARGWPLEIASRYGVAAAAATADIDRRPWLTQALRGGRSQPPGD